MMMSFILTVCLAATSHAVELDTRVLLVPEDVRLAHPEIVERVSDMEPVRNRAGAWYFPGADLTHPVAQALIQERVLARQDDESVRVALVYALDAEHRFDWSVIESEESSVRAAMIHGYKGLDTQESSAVLSSALRDASPVVRAEAARLVGYRPEAAELTPVLLAGLADTSAEVRRLSVRSLGWLEAKEAFSGVSKLLDDSAPSVRIAAVRALGKIDLQRARALPKMKALEADTNPGVQRALRRVVAP